MRKLHRWLAILFGAFLLWISATGLLSQIGSLVNNGGFEEQTASRGRAQAAALAAAAVPPARAHQHEAAAPPQFVCPADMTCRPKRVPKPGDWDLSLLHHLQSGEQFGPVGVILSMLSGLALFFFALSGLYMYIQMYRGRLARTEAGKSVRGGRLFW